MAKASVRPVGDDEIRAVLDSEDGAGHLVRALFGDCTADTLLLLAQDFDVPRKQLLAAYAVAKADHAAANETMDAVAEGASP